MYRVVIVEDEMFVRIGLEHAVDWKKYEMKVVGGAANGEEALTLYEKYNPHVIITDIKMPGMNGLELIERIRSRDKSIKFIILTCLEDFQMARIALENAVSFYFIKSDMNILEIEKAIEKIYFELNQQEDEKKMSQRLEKESGYDVIHQYIRESHSGEKEKMLKKYKGDEAYYVMISLKIKGLEKNNQMKRQRQFESVKEVVIALIKKQKIGELADIQNNTFYILYSLKKSEDVNLISELVYQLTYMIYSYFNLESCGLIGDRFDQINQVIDYYEELKKSQYVDFYVREKVITFQEIQPIQEIVKQGITKITEYYRMNFDGEYENEFCSYIQIITPPIIQNIAEIKKVIVQWIQLFMTIMHLTSENLIHYRKEVGEKIEKLEGFEEVITLFIEVMQKSKIDLEKQDTLSTELMKVIQFIRENLKERLSLSLVAKQVNFSSGYLSYMFKQQLNTSFTDFVLKLRIKQAKIYLAQTEWKLYKIAEEVGFQDPSYFNKVFKKVTGITPVAYKNRCVKRGNSLVERYEGVDED